MKRAVAAVVVLFGLLVVGYGATRGWWLSNPTGRELTLVDHWRYNTLGQDLLVLAGHALWHSLVVALVVASGATVLGICLGLLGATNRAMAAIVDFLAATMDSIPIYLLAIAAAVALGRSEWVLMAALAGCLWTDCARLMVAELQSLRQQPFIESLKLSRMPRWQRGWQSMLPHTLPIWATQAILIAITAIKADVVLTFLGLTALDRISFGSQLAAAGAELAAGDWAAVMIAGGGIMILVMIFTAINDGLQRTFSSWQSSVPS